MIFRPDVDARRRTIGRHAKQTRDQKSFFLLASVIVLVARRAELKPLRSLRWDREHGEVCIAHAGPIDRAADLLLIRALLRLVNALAVEELNLAVHRGDAFGCD